MDGRAATDQPLSRWMGWVLLQCSVFVAAMGLPLYALGDDVSEHFIVTLRSPLTGAFLGANYLAAGVIAFLGARQASWAHARIAVLAGFVLTALTGAVTAIHVEQLNPHLISAVWIGVHAVVLLQMVVAFVMQKRLPGREPPELLSMPLVMRILCLAQSLVLFGGGAMLMVATEGTPAWLPWQHTVDPAAPGPEPLAGAWLIAFGVAQLHAVVDGELVRLRPLMASLVVLPLLHSLALLRFSDHVDWSRPAVWGWLTLLMSVFLVGAWSLMRSTHAATLIERR